MKGEKGREKEGLSGIGAGEDLNEVECSVRSGE